jgi:sulfur carrier protein
MTQIWATLRTACLFVACLVIVFAMKLIINGEEKTFESAANVAELIAQLALKGDRIAVELNRDIVPRANWSTAELHDGDRLEIVHFVGGGLR